VSGAGGVNWASGRAASVESARTGSYISSAVDGRTTTDGQTDRRTGSNIDGEHTGGRSVDKTFAPARIKKGKGSPYSIIESGVPELIPVLGSQLAGAASHKPGRISCRYFPPGLQLPSRPLRGLLSVPLLGEQRHDGVNSLPKTVTRQRRVDCDLNPGPSASESNTLTTRLPSHPDIIITTTTITIITTTMLWGNPSPQT